MPTPLADAAMTIAMRVPCLRTVDIVDVPWSSESRMNSLVVSAFKSTPVSTKHTLAGLGGGAYAIHAAFAATARAVETLRLGDGPGHPSVSSQAEDARAPPHGRTWHALRSGMRRVVGHRTEPARRRGTRMTPTRTFA
jgi:hypothetical protein